MLASGSGAHLKVPEPAFAVGPPPPAEARHADRVATPSLCGGPETSSPYPWDTEYPWPIQPFDQQHAIRGYFGDPRTVFRTATDTQLGSFSFHNGIDIPAPEGTPVYPVIGGTVSDVQVNEVVVHSDDDRRSFQYWHIEPLVSLGQHVDAQHTVLGLVQAPSKHVHLTEIVDGVVQNPLQPHHITPYADSTAPVVNWLSFRSLDGKELNPDALTGTVELDANATDEQPLPSPAPWTGLPVSPASVEFDVTTPNGREVLPVQAAANFMVTEPQNRDFFDVYAPGTFQNEPAVGKRLYHGAPGEYLFALTPFRLDTATLEPGRYVVTVTAEDTCGNTGTLSEPITVLPQQPATDVARLRLVSWPRGARRAWTVVVASLAEQRGIDDAREIARTAVDDGLGSVSVLPTGRFPGLRAGSLLVTSGFYGSLENAQNALTRVERRYPLAYVRGLVARVRRPHVARAARHTGPARRTR
ncbi:MAG TPA: M23 family metallopeptidase [Gaiellaceae bacterium]|nr:M23 family metallopeptidase [Gaiellaceae bacterium]